MKAKLKKEYLTALRRLPNGVIRAPYWLRERMRRLRTLPPPTVEEVRIQFAASVEQMRRMDREAMGDIVR